MEPVNVDRLTWMMTGVSVYNSLDAILPHVSIGDIEAASDYSVLQKHGITHVLNATKEIENFFSETVDDPSTPPIQYLKIPVDDWEYEPIHKHFETASLYLDRVRSSGGHALVHCWGGVSRSSTLVIAHLMRSMGWTLSRAYSYVKMKRSIIEPNEGFATQLIGYEKELFGGNSMEITDFTFAPED